MIYLELVPRNQKLIADSHWAIRSFKTIQGINVPDILRISNRSYDAVSELAKHNINCIPHIRICDFSHEDLFKLSETLKKWGYNLLLISGDPPPNPLQPVFKHNLVKIIKELTKHIKTEHLRVAMTHIAKVLRRIHLFSKKLDGAKGLFTQPIFDLNLVNILLDQCTPCEWFIGISPVLSEKSYNYWTSRNNVVFPSDFKLSMDYNTTIAKEIIQLCEEKKQNNYIMPITCELQPYLTEVFNDKII